MNARSFLDTDILVYTDDHNFPEKQERALDIVTEARLTGNGIVSMQVLEEYYLAATQKLGVAAEVARRKVELFARLNRVQVDTDGLLAAIDLQHQHGFALWDALIVQSALKAGCTVLLSERLEHGRRVSSLEFVNPFI